jgi:hypothetical protein
MCTLSFIPHTNGYAVGMNRDELRSRTGALAPRYFECKGVTAVYPSETLGGTWIAVNAYGELFALLNWYSAYASTLTAKQRSRGEIIPQVIFDSDFRATATIFVSHRLAGILPFRLIRIDPIHRAINEWRWDGRRICRSALPWARKHWFSSSLSDVQAEEYRCATCTVAASVRDPGRPDWLRDLHRSHRPFSGPYSICVHRPDVVTVSYTEVLVNSRLISMRYVAGSPCESTGFHHVLDLPCYPMNPQFPACCLKLFLPPRLSCCEVGTRKD